MKTDIDQLENVLVAFRLGVATAAALAEAVSVLVESGRWHYDSVQASPYVERLM